MKKKLCIILINIIFLFIAILNRKNDYYDRNIYLEKFTTEYSDMVEFPDDNSYSIRINNTSDEKMLICSSDYYDVPEGKYNLYVEYETNRNIVIELYDDGSVNSNNEAGLLLASVTLDPNNNTCNIPVEFMRPSSQFKVNVVADGVQGKIESIHINGRKPFNDSLWVLFVIYVAEIILWRLYAINRAYFNRALIILGLTMIASLPIMNNMQYSRAHDITFHLGRLNSISQWMKWGILHEFPLKLDGAAHNGAGYVQLAMYPSVFLYPFAFLHILGISILTCYKSFLITINLATVIIGEYSFRHLLGEKAGYISVILYTFSLYRLGDLYTRIALGEASAMIFIPLVVYGVYELVYGNKDKWWLCVIGVTGVLNCHILSIYMVACFVVLFAILNIDHIIKDKRIVPVCKAALLTVGINLGFLIPFLNLYSHIKQLNAGKMFYSSMAYINQIFSSWIINDGINQDLYNTEGEMPFSIGGILLVGCIVFVLRYFYRKQEDRKWKIGFWCLGLGLLSVFLASNICPWYIFKGTRFDNIVSSIQFAWRWLTISSVLLSVVAGIAFEDLTSNENNYSFVIILTIILAVTVLPANYYFDSILQDTNKSKSVTERTVGYDSIYLPKNAKSKDSVGVEIIPSNENIVVKNVNNDYVSLSFEIDNNTNDAYFDLPYFYYPVYAAYDNNQNRLKLVDNGEGIVRVYAGNVNKVLLKYKAPVIWNISYAFSILVIVAYIVMTILKMKKAHKMGISH